MFLMAGLQVMLHAKMLVLLQRFTLHRTVFVWYRCTSDGDLYIQVEGKMKNFQVGLRSKK